MGGPGPCIKTICSCQDAQTNDVVSMFFWYTGHLVSINCVVFIVICTLWERFQLETVGPNHRTKTLLPSQAWVIWNLTAWLSIFTSIYMYVYNHICTVYEFFYIHETKHRRFHICFHPSIEIPFGYLSKYSLRQTSTDMVWMAAMFDPRSARPLINWQIMLEVPRPQNGHEKIRRRSFNAKKNLIHHIGSLMFIPIDLEQSSLAPVRRCFCCLKCWYVLIDKTWLFCRHCMLLGGRALIYFSVGKALHEPYRLPMHDFHDKEFLSGCHVVSRYRASFPRYVFRTWPHSLWDSLFCFPILRSLVSHGK